MPKSIKLLLVEDDDADAEFVMRAMRTSDRTIEVTWKQTLREARQYLTRTQPDVAIIDLGLPDSLGISNLQTLSGSESQLPIIVLSGWDGAFERRLQQLGAKRFFEKGRVSEASLVEAVLSAVDDPARQQPCKELRLSNLQSDLIVVREHLCEIERSGINTEQQISADAINALLEQALVDLEELLRSNPQ